MVKLGIALINVSEKKAALRATPAKLELMASNWGSSVYSIILSKYDANNIMPVLPSSALISASKICTNINAFTVSGK